MGFFVGFNGIFRGNPLGWTCDRRFRPPIAISYVRQWWSSAGRFLGRFYGIFLKPKKSGRLGSHIREAPGSRIFVSRSFLSFLEKSPNILTKLTQPTMAHGFFKPPERSAEISLTRPGMSDAEYDGRSGSMTKSVGSTSLEVDHFNGHWKGT